MLDPTFHITTPRLYLSYLDPANDAHMSFIVHLYNTPETRTLAAQSGVAPPNVHSIPEARAALAARTTRLSATGNGRYMISLRDPSLQFESQSENEYVGYVSMQLARYPSVPCPTIPDIGFQLLATHYGKGYASEACNALMQYFRETKGYEQFAGFTHPENLQSQKLFARLGFEKRGVVDVAGLAQDGSLLKVAVWLKDVSKDTALEELGIGSGRDGEKVGEASEE